MRTRLTWLVVTTIGAVALTPCATVPATAVAPTQPASLTAPVCAGDDGTDVNHDGRLDVAVGVPSEDRGSVAGAGVVEVSHPCSKQAPQSLALPKGRAHDGFGTAAAIGTLNQDAYLDLAVGVPGLDVKGHRDAGGVALFYGSAQGLRYAKTLTQASAYVGGTVQAHARFGQTLSLTGYVPDGEASLRIGEPGRTVAGQVGAGGVVDYLLADGAHRAEGSGEVTLATKGVPGSPRAGDAMGASLYSSYEVGIPGRTVNGARGAGAVLYTPYRHRGRYTLLTQASAGVPGTPEPGDHFGTSLSQAWIGVPGESVGPVTGAGIVIGPSDEAGRRVVLNQHDADPSQVVEPGDHFGAAMTETGVVVDDTEWAPRQLLVGAPGQDVAGHADAGTVSVVGESNDPDGGPFILGARYGELQPADVVTGAHFGAVLARNGLHTVQIGAPDARGGRLSRFVAPEQFDSLPALSGTQAQQAGTPEKGDRYGAAAVLSPL